MFKIGDIVQEVEKGKNNGTILKDFYQIIELNGDYARFIVLPFDEYEDENKEAIYRIPYNVLDQNNIEILFSVLISQYEIIDVKIREVKNKYLYVNEINGNKNDKVYFRKYEGEVNSKFKLERYNHKIRDGYHKVEI